MDANLKNLNWNPDTCTCRVRLFLEETAVVGWNHFDYAKHYDNDELSTLAHSNLLVVRPEDKSSVETPELHFVVGRYRTVRVDEHGEVIKDEYHGVHEPTDIREKSPAHGQRWRGEVYNRCSIHEGFNEEVQTQRLRCTGVCGCVFQELRIGKWHKQGYFGAFFEQVCRHHGESIRIGSTALSILRYDILAEANGRVETKEIDPPPQQHGGYLLDYRGDPIE